MKKLIILGTGDYAEMALKYISRDQSIAIVAFSVERDYIKAKSFQGLPVIPFEEMTSSHPTSDHQIIAAIGPNKVNTVRERLFNEGRAKGYDMFTYISERAHVWDTGMIGSGSFIFDGCVVEPGASVGENTVLWSNATIAHHSRIGDHCFLAPGASVSGRIEVKNNCFLGINCTIRDNVVIAERCIVGGGAVIKKDTVADGVYSAKGSMLRNSESFDTRI